MGAVDPRPGCKPGLHQSLSRHTEEAMPIHVACPGCGRKFQAPDSLSGKRVKCPGCATAFVVNAPTPDVPDPRLTPCPDCGKVISKRADQCPHCGCPIGRPAASAAGQPALPGNDPATEAVPKRRRPVLVVAGALLAFVAIAIPAAYIVWQQSRAAPQAEPLAPAPVVSAPQPPAITAEQREAWRNDAAVAAARQIDDLQRQVHSVDVMLKQAQANTDLIQSLAQGQFPEPGELPQSAAATEAAPYQSQYEGLFQECLEYLRQGVLEPSGREEVVAAAERWAAEKRRPLEEHMQGVVSDPMGL